MVSGPTSPSWHFVGAQLGRLFLQVSIYIQATFSPPANVMQMAFHWWAESGPMLYADWVLVSTTYEMVLLGLDCIFTDAKRRLSRQGRVIWLLYFTILVSLCHVSISVLCLFLTMPCIGLQFVNALFSGHTHLLLALISVICL